MGLVVRLKEGDRLPIGEAVVTVSQVGVGDAKRVVLYVEAPPHILIGSRKKGEANDVVGTSERKRIPPGERGARRTN